MLNHIISASLALAMGVNAATHIISVGANHSLLFSPNSTTAAIGDSLEFHFYNGTGAHSVVSSTFSSVCQPNPSAFFSGYITGDTTGTPTFTYTLTSTDPIWYYCSLGSHCAKGMVGVVNPPQGETVEQYAAAAKDASAAAPSVVTGGVVNTAGGGASMTMANSTVVVGSSTTGVAGSGSTATATATTTMTSSGGAGASTTASGSGTGSVAATTTPSAAGRGQDVSVMLGLVPILGGLVALMA